MNESRLPHMFVSSSQRCSDSGASDDEAGQGFGELFGATGVELWAMGGGFPPVGGGFYTASAATSHRLIQP
jgi:hypothetical protein